jgi:hypothetical protein
MKCEVCKKGDLIHTDYTYDGVDLLVCSNEECGEEYV